MKTVKIEIEDTLQDRITNAKSELVETVVDFLARNKKCTDLDDWYNGDEYGCDQITEIADSNVPVYDSEIDGLYYLYSDELEEAYENQGIGDGREENHKQVTIYCYISEQVNEIYNSLDEWVKTEFKNMKSKQRPLILKALKNLI